VISRTYFRSRIERSAPSGRDTVEIHGTQRSLENVRQTVRRLREDPWYWKKSPWIARDVAVDRKWGSLSFDLRLAEDSPDFEVVKGGWTRDRCEICSWELFESIDDPVHGEGYTNGHDWLCLECYEKFLTQRDFFSSSHPEST
jgi:hypothetical protein